MHEVLAPQTPDPMVIPLVSPPESRSPSPPVPEFTNRRSDLPLTLPS
jgi:hypothetical protein